MSDSPRIPGRSTIVVLVAVAVCALLTTTTITVVILTDRGPQRSESIAVGYPPT